MLTSRTAPRTPPPQGLCQVRLFPDSIYRWWSPASRQQRPRPVQHRREEEGLLSSAPEPVQQPTSSTGGAKVSGVGRAFPIYYLEKEIDEEKGAIICMMNERVFW